MSEDLGAAGDGEHEAVVTARPADDADRAAVAAEAADDVAELFSALGSPVRVGLVDHLSRGELCVHELVELLGLPQPLVSQHLRVLRSARLVVSARRGREVSYSLVDEHVSHIVADALRHAREHLTA